MRGCCCWATEQKPLNPQLLTSRFDWIKRSAKCCKCKYKRQHFVLRSERVDKHLDQSISTSHLYFHTSTSFLSKQWSGLLNNQIAYNLSQKTVVWNVGVPSKKAGRIRVKIQRRGYCSEVKSPQDDVQVFKYQKRQKASVEKYRL